MEQRLEESEREHERFRALYQRNSLDLSEKNKELMEKIKEVEILRANYENNLKDVEKNMDFSHIRKTKIAIERSTSIPKN